MGAVNTWPISQRQTSKWTCFGIPDQLGDGCLWRAGDIWPSLEEVGRDDWMGSVLLQLLPDDQAWMWWTRSKTYRQARIPSTRAKARVDSQALTGVVARRFPRRGMTAAFLPPEPFEPRGGALYWSGVDTEQIPDHIWAATSPSVVWDVDQVARWCADREQWSDPDTLPTDIVGRAVTLFDRHISLAVPTPEADKVMRTLRLNAGRWRLRLIPGPPEYAWPAAQGSVKVVHDRAHDGRPEAGH
jgi:hypothetical protein